MVGSATEHVILITHVQGTAIKPQAVDNLPLTAESVRATEIHVIVMRERDTATGVVFWEYVHPVM
jgi:hypothetical protein